jgi:uncharacterized alpha/beta hydrolase family protein
VLTHVSVRSARLASDAFKYGESKNALHPTVFIRGCTGNANSPRTGVYVLHIDPHSGIEGMTLA